MNKKHNLLGILLSAVCGLYLLAAMLLKVFLPRIILPDFNASLIVVISLVALLIDYYIIKISIRNYILIPIYSLLIFGLFPFGACLLTALEALKSGILGCVIFTLATFLFDSINDRLSTGKASKIAPLISAFGMFLAIQCFMGII